MKLTIMITCSTRFSRVNRSYSSSPSTAGRMPAEFAAHLQRARQPQQGMCSADGEGHHQQAGHCPEDPEEEGVLAGVVVGRVRQVPGEAPRGARMALLARGHHVVATQVRARVGDRQDVVRTVAVVALRRLGVAEARDLAVIGLEVRLGDRLVAAAALAHDAELEALRVGAADGVRGVAVIAHRQLLVGLCDARRVHAALELLVDAGVTGAARLAAGCCG